MTNQSINLIVSQKKSINLIVIILILKNSIASSNPMCMHTCNTHIYTCMWRERKLHNQMVFILVFIFNFFEKTFLFF